MVTRNVLRQGGDCATNGILTSTEEVSNSYVKRPLAGSLAQAPIKPPSMSERDADLPRKVLRETAKKFGTRIRDLQGPSRRKSIIVPRAVAMFLLRQLTAMSLIEVGKHFRRRDHTTVLHACRKIQKQLPEDPLLRETLLNILDALDIPTPPKWLANYVKIDSV